MTEKEILALIEQGEGPDRAFLPARSSAKRVGETLVALANTHGGHVVMGVRGWKRLSLEGVSAPEETRALVLEAAQGCGPPMVLPVPEVVSVQGSTLLVITVPAGLPYAYNWQGVYLHRSEGKNALLGAAELRSLLLERGEEGFGALVAPRASLDDLDMKRVTAYAALLEDAPADHLQLLEQRGCIVDTPDGQRPTNAGLLLFGKEPQTFLPQAQILLVRHAGTIPGREVARLEVRGTLPEQIQPAEKFLRDHMRRGRILVDAERVEVPEYPLGAVREAIVNAVAHRDYSIRGDEIRVSMFLDRIEVYSPGRLPGPITVDNIVEERFSRNPAIVQVLADVSLIERLGYGIDRMVALMEKAHLPPPAFRELRAGFLLTLRGPRGVPPGDLPADPQALARLGLNERQVQALLYVSEQGRITTRDFQELSSDVSAETLRRDLVDLVSRGLLLKVGERRATYYILK